MNAPLTDALDSVVAFIRRYAVLPSDAAYDTVALWTAHTWAFDAADATPYLIVTSPLRQCGKTRLLELVETLVRRPWQISAPPTEAVLFRAIEASRPTILLDEADRLFGAGAERIEPLVAILNAGTRRGATVPRCVGPNHDVRDFTVFAPKLVAGIDASRWPDTIRDRGIIIELRRKAPSETVDRWRARDAEPVAAEIRECLASAISEVVEQLRQMRPADVAEISDRAFDGWESLLAIAEVAGDDWLRRARLAAVELSTPPDIDDEQLGVILLADLRGLFDDEHVLFTASALDALNGLDERPWPAMRNGTGLNARTAHRLLKPFGVRSRTVRHGEQTAKGWLRDQFDDAWSRYLPALPDPSQNPSQRHNGHSNGASCDGVTANQEGAPEAGFEWWTEEVAS